MTPDEEKPSAVDDAANVMSKYGQKSKSASVLVCKNFKLYILLVSFLLVSAAGYLIWDLAQ